MKVDFQHPANEKVLRYLRNPYDFISGPKSGIFREARERDLAASRHKESQSPESMNWLHLGTHPDILERFWREITALLPEPCSWIVYGTPVLVHPPTGIIFGWASGSFDYTLRLPEEIRREALKTGAKTITQYSTGDTLDLAVVGEEWVFGKWFKEEEEWCLKAYEYAASQCTPGT